MRKMKAYADFDDYLRDQTPRNQAIIRALRRFVKRIEPGLSEAVKWGNGCWVGSNGPVAYVYSATGYVQFGFFNGSSLKDPRGLLEGKGKYVRHTKVRDPPESTNKPWRRSSSRLRTRLCVEDAPKKTLSISTSAKRLSSEITIHPPKLKL